ncbi:MAG TPA: tetratricopeptide repeat protein [Hyphomicrobiaceae bacterium]|nr:tetratricopeptide repeat protein [Hyphomicrobiaceae bacterium]
MEKPVESVRSARARGPAPLEVRLLGPLAVQREGEAVKLPASRKVRALMGYLALAPAPVSRSHLCELLWDVPNDPRGELRWCLSKLRGMVDGPDRHRVEVRGDSVRLDLADAAVDALEITEAAQQGIAGLAPERLRTLAELFGGELLDGLQIDRSPAFGTWLTAQRRRFRGCQVAVLEHLAADAGGEEAVSYLEKWVELAPFDLRAHERLLAALARRSRVREGDEHLAAAIALFEADGLDPTPLREAWRSARARAESMPRVQTITAAQGARGEEVVADSPTGRPRRASIAVMPFAEMTPAAMIGGLAGNLAYDVITRLAKLRSLFVIAQGTVFALAERRVGPEEAGRILNVDYIVSGALRRHGNRLNVRVELAETRTARIVWTEVFDQKVDDAFQVLDEIGNRIVASIATEIETLERNRAILKPPSSLDAWEAHHRGLWHMYRFNKEDNARAQQFFETAVRLDPTFARAYAGLSFTHWQNAFQGWAGRETEAERAFEVAGQSLMVDDRDPAAHWAMGRALWLLGRQDQSVAELERAVDLSPNFAQGHYALAFVHSQGGDARAAVEFSDHSRQLSPFDPMLFAMLGARAMALVRLGRYEEAADWAARAAARPNAHAHIRAIAALCIALADRSEEARAAVAAIHRQLPHYRVGDFLAAFRFAPDAEERFRKVARRIGLG